MQMVLTLALILTFSPREKEQRLSVFCFTNDRPANPAAGFSKDASICSASHIFWWSSFGGCHLAFSLQICVNS
jgi:hypothetical protein